MSKWDDRYVELVTSVARNWGPHGVQWGDVAKEMGESAKACESAFWRLSQEDNGQASTDAKLLRMKMNTSRTYAEIAAEFPGYTIEELKARMKVLSGRGGGNKWIEGLRIGFIDIEASDLKSNVGIMLSWAIKDKDGGVEWDAITREEAIDWDEQDRRIAESLAEALTGYDMLCGWYSTNFDIPAIRTRMEWWEIDNPLEYGDRIHYDLYYTARSKLNLHSNRLESVANFFGIEMEYKDLTPYDWKKARLGYPDAIDYIVKHNIEDVEVTEQVFHKLKRFKKLTRKSV